MPSEKVRARSTIHALVFGAFALCALLLSALGLYGLLSLAVTERTKEIGVRIALGAHVGRLVRRVVGEGLVLMAAGALVGILGAALLLRTMQTLLFGVTPQDVTTYVGVVGVLFAVAVLASYIPARRVARGSVRRAPQDATLGAAPDRPARVETGLTRWRSTW